MYFCFFFITVAENEIHSNIHNEQFRILISNVKQLEVAKVNDWNALYANVEKYISCIDTITKGRIGSWSVSSDSIPYASRTQTVWKPVLHLDRIYELTMAYIYENSPYYNRKDIFSIISKATQYWHDRNPTSTNWWFQEIAAPQKMGLNLLLLHSGQNFIPSEYVVKILDRMRLQSSRLLLMTAANKIDIALHVFYRGILERNEELINAGVDAAKSTIFKSKGVSEGLQVDFSYLQHGQQFYTTGYGEESIKGLINFLFILKGSKYVIPLKESEHFLKFVREHYFLLFRSKYYMTSGIGRHIAIKGRLTGAAALRNAKLLQMIDVKNESVYNSIIKSLSGSENASFGMHKVLNHYWVGDYTLYSSPSYNFDVRFATTRTCRVGTGNSTNLKGYFLTEGSNNILVDGNEYFDIFPVWDWSMLPGTTLPHKNPIPNTFAWETLGNSTLGGGVTNGKVGITVYEMNNFDYDVNTKAKKSWFMFGNEIVCLGAGITSSAIENVNTTINQCHFVDNIVVNINSEEIIIERNENHVFNGSANWVYHAKVGYCFPTSTNISLSSLSQNGSWHSISSFYEQDNLSKDVFKLWINHGLQPFNSTYSYIIVPNKTLHEFRGYDASKIQILLNTDSIQVVYNKNENIMGLVFYKPARFSISSFQITSSGSCLILLKNPFSKNVEGWISDPSQIQDKITVELKPNRFSR